MWPGALQLAVLVGDHGSFVCPCATYTKSAGKPRAYVCAVCACVWAATVARESCMLYSEIMVGLASLYWLVQRRSHAVVLL